MAREFKVDIKDGMFVGLASGGEWKIEEGKRREIPDLVTRIKMGLSMDWVIRLPVTEFKAIPEGEPMPKIPLGKRSGKKPVMR